MARELARPARIGYATRVRRAAPLERSIELIALIALASLASLAAACDEPRRRPWDQASDGAPPPVLTASPSSFLSPTSSLAASGAPASSSAATTGSSAEPAASGAPLLEPVAETPVPVGGPWVRCYGNFRVSGDPLKDVTRLGLLCGPENGMKRFSQQAIVGSVIEGHPGVTETLEARRGECYRIFAVAERTVSDLDVTVRSSREMAIAADHGEDAWPIVQPDRPFCVLEDDALRVEIAARRGQGRFAAEIWVLPAPKRAD